MLQCCSKCLQALYRCDIRRLEVSAAETACRLANAVDIKDIRCEQANYLSIIEKLNVLDQKQYDMSQDYSTPTGFLSLGHFICNNSVRRSQRQTEDTASMVALGTWLLG
ncbi:MAG: hypothetical protein HN929_14295 [Chloroflexi bacterium]|jgi:hypothetical protein|nr:hypothetical protein [Chloroflexota bacterium]